MRLLPTGLGFILLDHTIKEIVGCHVSDTDRNFGTDKDISSDKKILLKNKNKKTCKTCQQYYNKSSVPMCILGK